jgi:two-component system cell cycle sensor histidine kinase/response regulator CckA
MPRRSKSGPTTPGVAALGSKRLAGVVLLVEDEPSVRAVACRMMEMRGLTVFAADGPEQALRISADHKGRLDILLTDVQMPGMAGSELAGLIRKARPEIKVVFISGYSREDAFVNTPDDATAEFLQKPFTPGQLIEVLGRILSVDTPPPASHNDTQRIPKGGAGPT